MENGNSLPHFQLFKQQTASSLPSFYSKTFAPGVLVDGCTPLLYNSIKWCIKYYMD